MTNGFSPAARIITGRDKDCGRVLYRMKFQMNGGEGLLRIASEGVYTLYINGERVVTRRLVSYDFHKYYDDIDIGRYVKRGVNCLAVACRWAFIAEIFADGSRVAATDASVLCAPDAALKADTLNAPNQMTSIGAEEWYDS